MLTPFDLYVFQSIQLVAFGQAKVLVPETEEVGEAEDAFVLECTETGDAEDWGT